MPENYINYISFIYGLIFLVISFDLLRKTRKVTSHYSKNVFWAFTAFAIMKSVSILSASVSVLLPASGPLVSEIITTLSSITLEISNLFLFHFGISILTYRASLHIDYKVFPAMLFFIYAVMNFSGIWEPGTSEKISRYCFGFSGAVLGSFGYVNIYRLKHDLHEERKISETVICSITLLYYSFTEGIITNPVFGMPIEVLRLSSAVILLFVSLFVVDLLEEEKASRVGFV